MKCLELKIPPPIVLFASGFVMWVLDKKLPGLSYTASIRHELFIFFIFVGISISLLGVYAFKKASTTVNPLKPESTTSLVTSGVYKITRNPMYLGMSFVLLAWGLYLSNIYSLCMVSVFVLYIHRFQIKPEERALKRMFGESFLAYKNNVGRWL